MSQSAVVTAPSGLLVDLNARLIDFTNSVGESVSAKEVLDGLHCVSTTGLPLNVLGAARLPIKANNLAAVQLGKSAFPSQRGSRGLVGRVRHARTQQFCPGHFSCALEPGVVYLDGNDQNVGADWR